MEAQTTVTLDQNYSDCLRSINNIGSTTIQNICDGTSTVVPWGALDWVAAVLIGLVVLGIAGIFIRLAFTDI